MDFPPWIERLPPKKRASARLKYMLNQAGLVKFGTTSIRTIAAKTPYDHSSIFCAIKRGYFTDVMAREVARVLASPTVTPELLVNPLNATFAQENAQ